MKRCHLLPTLFLLLLSACATIPGTNRKGFIVISRQQEIQMGEQAYRETLAKEKLSTDARLNTILQRVGKRIAAVTPVSDFQWEFKLVESKQMNAFCLPGGKVAIYTGILPVMQNEAALAVVMGHEVAHAVARHGAQRVSQALATQLGLAVFDATVLRDSKYRNVVMGGLGVGTTLGILLPFSRDNETEADTLGLRYAAAAGYDPSEGPRFWERFSKAAGGKPPEFLSTHPSDSSRIANMRRLSAEAAAAYAASPQYGLGENL